MKIEGTVTGKQFRFYDDDGNYLGAVRVEIRGPRCILDSLDSKHFYKNFDMIFEFINVSSNTYIWNCHLTPEHLTAVQRLIGKRYRAEILSVEKMDGHELLWCEIIKR